MGTSEQWTLVNEATNPLCPIHGHSGGIDLVPTAVRMDSGKVHSILANSSHIRALVYYSNYALAAVFLDSQTSK